MAVVVDTNIVSYIFKEDSRAADYERHLIQVPKFISFMSLAELRRWEHQSNWGPAKSEKFEKLLSDFGVIYADSEMCDIWARTTNDCSKKGRPIAVADAWVASVALMFDIPLVTHNRKHFDHISGLSVL